jgi:2-furoyl-CoA dehydrogenase large subunit
MPLETYGVIASWEEARDAVTLWANFHGPFILKTLIAQALGLPDCAVRVIVPPDIGGSFGIKAGLYPYMALMALASRLVGRPVKWIESRREHLVGSSFGAGRIAVVEAGFNREGLLLGLRYRFMDDVGAYIRSPEPATLYRCFGNMTGPYRVRDVELEMLAVMTNKAPTGLNRGFGGPQLYFALESVMDMAAERLGLDPVEIRLRNLITADSFPYETPTGGIYDSGNFEEAVRRLLVVSEYERLRQEQKQARAEGRYVGIGVATVVDPSGTNMGYIALARTAEERAQELAKSGSTEIVTVGVDPFGRVIVRLGSCPQGQGHETVAAQVVADELGLRPEEVLVLCEMDTGAMAWTVTTGSYSSRFAGLGVSALVSAARQIKEKMRGVAAVVLEAAVDEVEYENGRFFVRGAPERWVPWRRVAGAAHWNAGMFRETAGLEAIGVFEPGVSRPADRQDRINSSVTYGFLADLAVVEVDRETFEVRVRKYVSVHDAGRILNPMIVQGQVYGALAHGLGMALKEIVVYDDGGQPLTGTLAEYAAMRMSDMPEVVLEHLETASPVTLLGAKGVGEGHTMSAPAAVANAIADALRALGIRPTVLPVTANWIFEELRKRG